uniref:Uncharacterized protein n=1 Tax=Anguilla anguilla TaxID=7936 RepID=A0A0E9XQM6_ANGAN
MWQLQMKYTVNESKLNENESTTVLSLLCLTVLFPLHA